MRAPCLSEAMAQAYSDNNSGPSHQAMPQYHSKPRKAHRLKGYTRRSLYASMLLLMLAVSTTQALFDPGDSSTAPVPIKENVAAISKNEDSSGKGPTVDSSLSLIAPKGQPISLHPGCRRTTDLFENVCQNPWSPILGGSRKSPAGRSELVICPLGEVESGGTKEKIFAITGTVTLPESISDQVQVSASSIESYRLQSNALGDKESHWPKPGDEGFWRQRDGELEWVPNEARAPLESDTTPANSVKEATESLDKGDKISTEAQAKEYNAWSESIGGEDSETWLSFDQWREKHLELEKQKNAAQRKQKAEKAKEEKRKAAHGHMVGGATVNATEITSEAQTQPTPTTQQAFKDGNVSRSESISSPPILREEAISSSKIEERPADASTDIQPQSQRPSVSVDTEGEQPAAIKADSSQDTGTIPAVGDASVRLTELKHRWNFASFDCAAVVHRSNPSAKFTSAILSEKKDRYMLSPCPEQGGEDQFVVVELCDEISVDTVVLANYEFFSRMFKKFRVRVSRNLNGGEDEWYDIGSFRARNIRGLQVFNTVSPKADSRFFRYVRIDFLEHYGSEFYCPVSLLRVYGLTQMDDYIREEEEMKKQREAELTLAESDATEEEEEKETKTIESVTESMIASADSSVTTNEVATSSLTSIISSAIKETPIVTSLSPLATALQPSPSDQPTAEKKVTLTTKTLESAAQPIEESSRKTAAATPEMPMSPELDLNKPVIEIGTEVLNMMTEAVNETQATNKSANDTIASLSNGVNATIPQAAGQGNDTAANATIRAPVALPASDTTANASIEDNKDRAVNATSSGTSTVNQSNVQESSKPAGSNQQHHGGSESIYRTITKRLNMLEQNATLSSQYMEHSRQQLREVFNRMERNQRDKIADMLRELNSSNWRQIESLKRRQQLDLQQAIFEFDKHRQQTDAERRALLAQMHILSNEVILEKRFGVAQLVLLLGLFVFMVLTRGSRAVPLIHEGIARMSKTPPRSSTVESVDKLSQKQESISDKCNAQLTRPDGHSLSSSRNDGRNRSRTTGMASRVERLSRLVDRPVRHRGGSIHRYGSSQRRHSVSHSQSVNLGKAVPDMVPSKAKHPSLSPEKRRSVLKPLENGTVSNAIKVNTTKMPLKTDELDTPVSSQFYSRNGRLDRENTPTDEYGMRSVKAEAPSRPVNSPSIDDSFGGSDWGTERSDNDEESHASFDLQDEDTKSLIITDNMPSPLIISTSPLSSNHIKRIVESDAEEDSPYQWNSVKSRRSLKRSGSSGINHSNSNGRNHPTPSHTQSHNHTPTNHTR